MESRLIAEQLVKDAGALGWTEVGTAEAALIQRCTAGEQGACAELVASHERMVYQLAFHLLADRDEALDLSQEVFLRVFRTLPSFRGQSALRTWIYRIAINQARNRQRWWRRRRRGDQVQLEQHVLEHGELRQPGDSDSPDRVLARKELATKLWSALDHLPFDQRTVVVLREIDGMSYEEIAESLDVAIGTVKSRLTRARQTLRRELQGDAHVMHVLPCDRVRERLEAFVDAEMTLDEQVSIQSHLHECVSCRLEVSELSEIGHALRVAPATGNEITHETGRLTNIILERIRLEQQLSFGVRFRDLFSDMHLVWAGLGATLAMVICIFASAGVLQAASRERPDSLAGLIDYLANPGSNENPVRLDDYMSAPRASFDASMPMPTEDADLAVAAVVTREGRVRNLEVVAEQARELRVKPEVVLAMLDAAARARFEPARAGGAPVAVSMVWLLSTTTVKGRPDYNLYLLRPPQWATQSGPSAPVKVRPVEAPVKPAPTGDGAAAG